MKRRVIKKWINRYITPLVKDMPQTRARFIELQSIDDENECHAVQGVNVIIANGEQVNEGQRYRRTKGLYNDIRNTAELARKIIPTLNNPFLRMTHAMKGRGFYLRIIDFKDWPEGYVYRPLPEER